MNKEVQMWLRRAKSSLVLSKTPKDNDIFYEDLCFDAQQSAEKSLKALIIHQGLKPPKTHSFRVLINEIKKRMTLPETVLDVLDLDDYAIFTRYPGDYRPIDDDEYHDAVRIAEYIYNWVVDNTK